VKREDGFYRVRCGDNWQIAKWESWEPSGPSWFRHGYDGIERSDPPIEDSFFDEIGPRVQRDSDLVKQLSDGLGNVRTMLAGKMSKGEFVNEEWYNKADVLQLLARIEAAKSGVAG